ncbi:transposase [Kitasatospora aureofaciens]
MAIERGRCGTTANGGTTGSPIEGGVRRGGNRNIGSWHPGNTTAPLTRSSAYPGPPPRRHDGGGQVIAQREVGSETNGITVFKPLLAPLELAGTVVTFDALHSQTEHARFLVEAEQAHYIAAIKGNHPALQQEPKGCRGSMCRCRADPAPPRTAATRSTGSRPAPSRAASASLTPSRSCAAAGPSPPARSPSSASTARLVPTSPGRPADLASWVRGHWGIENKIHHVRDTTYTEAPACAPVPSPGQWPACATSRSLPSGTSATTTSRPASAITPADPRRPLATFGIT